MSSTFSTTEIKTIPPRAVTKLKMEAKPARLVRTSSIEKIRRFNSFICSQQYYVLPALLSWLKSSQSGLQASTETTIFLFRSVIFNTFFYKLYQVGFRFVGSAEKNFFRILAKCFQSTFLLAVAVYCACAAVLLQLAVALYVMYCSLLPYGFLFMLGCMLTINYLCFKTSLCLGNKRRDSKVK